MWTYWLKGFSLFYVYQTNLVLGLGDYKIYYTNEFYISRVDYITKVDQYLNEIELNVSVFSLVFIIFY